MAAALVLPAAGMAQQQAPAQAVRLSYVEGQVRITQTAGDGSSQVITDQAVANTPLFAGYVLQTGDDGRAEVQFDDGTVGRIPPDSGLALTALGGPQSVLTLSSGMAYFTLHGPEQIQAAGAAITSNAQADLRVKLDEAPGEVAVFTGTAHVSGNGSVADLSGGQSVKLAPQGGFSVAENIEPDSWDAWNTDREQALITAAAAATPATQGLPDSSNPAWGDLNQNGNWYNVPDQGYVWSPYDASDPNWDPYGNGYWMDTPSYGYTWVSGYSWGYLPFQCGLWNWYTGFGWGWAPGGCTPWWRGVGGGFGNGWFINIGNRPNGWRPPVRPNRPRWGGFGGGNGRTFRPAPIVPIRRQGPSVADGGVLPLRDRRSPVTIGNATVVPLRPNNRPVTNRPVYNHQFGQGQTRFNPGGVNNPPNFNPPAVENGRQGYTQAPNYNRPGGNQQQPGGWGQPNGASHARPAPGGVQQYQPQQQPRQSAPAPRAQAPQAARPPAASRPAPSAPPRASAAPAGPRR